MQVGQVITPGKRLQIGLLSKWAAPVAALVALWLWMAFSSGGYLPRQWLPASLFLAFLGLTSGVFAAYPRRPRQLSLAFLGCFGLYAVWVSCSALWAASTSRVWLEAGRTSTYLLLLLLALTYLSDARARSAFKYLLLVGSLCLLIACALRLWFAQDVSGLMLGNRLSYPVSYPNGAAALFLIPFWPLVWLAGERGQAALVRGVSLGAATGLLALAFLTQSRGAFWALGVTAVITFIVSPTRLKNLFYLLVPSLLMVWAFPKLNGYSAESARSISGTLAGSTVIAVFLIAAFAGTILALLEGWIKVGPRMRVAVGSTVLLAVLAGFSYGLFQVTQSYGGPTGWVSAAWQHFKTSQPLVLGGDDSSSANRLMTISDNGRIDLWRVAWLDFRENPVTGVGADNFVFTYDRLGEPELTRPRQAHSIELQALSETGIPGTLFLFGSMLLVVVGLQWARWSAALQKARRTWARQRKTAAGDLEPAGLARAKSRWGMNPEEYGWEMALLVAFLYWLVHGSVDWLWQITGITIPALLMLAAAIAGIDARAGDCWLWKCRQAGGQGKGRSGGGGMAEGPEAAPDEAGDAVESGRSGRRIGPSGPMSRVVRVCLIAVSASLLAGTAIPELALSLQNSALAGSADHPATAIARANLAVALFPLDAGALSTRAHVYETSAQTLAALGDSEQAGALLDNLALALDSSAQAVQREPSDWSKRYEAGMAALNLLLARDALDGGTLTANTSDLVGLEDWSGLRPLSGSLETIRAPGESAGSLATSPATIEAATRYRNMSQEELRALADAYFNQARDRYPHSPEVEAALITVRSLVSFLPARS